jgi:large subunit ribosomal protein L14
MKALPARMTRGCNLGTMMVAADNSGALLVRLVGVVHGKVGKRTQMYAKVGDQVKVSVRKGLPDMKGKVFDAVVVRQKKPFRRLTGERISFVDNAVVILKDDKGNPKGTQVKGPVAREIHDRYPGISKIAKFVL